MSKSNTWIVCLGIPGVHDELIEKSDRDAFLSLSPNAKVFECVEMREEGMISLKHKDQIFRVDAHICKVVNEPKYKWNEQVEIIEKLKLGKIIDIRWHIRDSESFYFLEIEGKESGRRYKENELRKVE